MRFVQLRAFHYVAISGGFSRAAEVLHLTQPAISDQVRRLEEEYDILLFNRSRKQVVLTRAGQSLLEVTHRLFETEKQALELLTESRALRSGSLRIIADSAHHILHILGEFRRQYPGIDIAIHAGNSAAVISRLHNYEADVGVLGQIPESRDFELIKLSSAPLIGFVAAGHPLAGRGEMTLAELMKQSLVLRETGSMTRRKLEEAVAEQGLNFPTMIEAEGREAVREIVATGAGVGIVSAAEFNTGNNLVPIRFSDYEILMDEAIICLRERTGGKLVSAFLKIARAHAQAQRELTQRGTALV